MESDEIPSPRDSGLIAIRALRSAVLLMQDNAREFLSDDTHPFPRSDRQLIAEEEIDLSKVIGRHHQRGEFAAVVGALMCTTRNPFREPEIAEYSAILGRVARMAYQYGARRFGIFVENPGLLPPGFSPSDLRREHEMLHASFWKAGLEAGTTESLGVADAIASTIIAPSSATSCVPDNENARLSTALFEVIVSPEVENRSRREKSLDELVKTRLRTVGSDDEREKNARESARSESPDPSRSPADQVIELDAESKLLKELLALTKDPLEDALILALRDGNMWSEASRIAGLPTNTSRALKNRLRRNIDDPREP